MARICDVCGKRSSMQWRYKKLRGHYNPTVKVRKYPNLQTLETADGSRTKACTSCIRTANKVRKPRKVAKAEKKAAEAAAK